MTARARHLLMALGTAGRAGWLAFGALLLLLVVVELADRGFRTARAAISGLRSSRGSQHPYAGQSWWPALQREVHARPTRFDASRTEWGRHFAGHYLNIDSAGRRVTPQPSADGQPRLVWMLGGSALWGESARDSATIPAFMAAELRARGIRDVEVWNLAQPGFNAFQETTALLAELGRGEAPAVAVLLDGVTDLAAALEYGDASQSAIGRDIERRIQLGRRPFWQELIGLPRHGMVGRYFSGQPTFGRGRSSALATGPGASCSSLTTYYKGITTALAGVAREQGFLVIHFLQPMHHASAKPLTPWERSLPRPPPSTACLRSLDSVLAGQAGFDSLSLAHLFDDETTTVFIDDQGDLTEAANRKVAARIAEIIARRL